MPRRELIYHGLLTAPSGEQRQAEVWWNGSLAIIFAVPGNAQLAALEDMERSLTDDNRLAFTGSVDGEKQTWEATAAEYTILNWVEQKVYWPDGSVWEKATVTATNYRVTVQLRGHEPRSFLGARAVDQWGRRWIISDDLRIEVQPAKGCGCGK